MCEASKPFHALEHLFLLCRGFSAFWPAGFSTSSRRIVIFRLIIFRLVRHDRFIFFSSLSSLFVCSVFQGNHDESSALATQCETPCATRLSYHGICTILRAIGTIYVIRKCPIERTSVKTTSSAIPCCCSVTLATSRWPRARAEADIARRDQSRVASPLSFFFTSP